MGRRGSIDKDASVVMEDDVVDLVGGADISVGSDEVEIVHDEDEIVAVSGRESRRARRDKRNSEGEGPLGGNGSGAIEPVSEMAIPDPPLADPVSALVTCSGCGSRFATEPGTVSMKCPVCGTRIGL